MTCRPRRPPVSFLLSAPISSCCGDSPSPSSAGSPLHCVPPPPPPPLRPAWRCWSCFLPAWLWRLIPSQASSTFSALMPPDVHAAQTSSLDPRSVNCLLVQPLGFLIKKLGAYTQNGTPTSLRPTPAAVPILLAAKHPLLPAEPLVGSWTLVFRMPCGCRLQCRPESDLTTPLHTAAGGFPVPTSVLPPPSNQVI